MLEQLTDQKISEASDILHINADLGAYQLAADLEVEIELAQWLLDAFHESADIGSVMLKRDAQVAITESRASPSQAIT